MKMTPSKIVRQDSVISINIKFSACGKKEALRRRAS